MRTLLAAILLSAAPMSAIEPTTTAVNATNALGIDLLRQVGKSGANALLSPYSIQSALVLAYAGAEGNTRIEMAKALHYPVDVAAVHESFVALRIWLYFLTPKNVPTPELWQKQVEKIDDNSLIVVNRLFGQSGYAFRDPFLALLRDRYAAPFEPLDFARNPSGATRHINTWVAEQTRRLIRDLIPDGASDGLTRLVLVNAMYLKAPWAFKFLEELTQPRPFYLGASNHINVPTMSRQLSLGFAQRDGCTMLAIPYGGIDLQFLILLPEQVNGLADLESKLTARLLADCAKLDHRQVILYLPKFKLESPTISLGAELQALGMKSAFDQPPGSANFGGIAPRQPDDYLYISDVFHKTVLNLDEKGTEATAATAATMFIGGLSRQESEPIEVRVDHPFLFAIQHRASKVCLFLGRMNDPR